MYSSCKRFKLAFTESKMCLRFSPFWLMMLSDAPGLKTVLTPYSGPTGK